MDRIELAPGYSISRIIKGCWQLSVGHGVQPESPEQALQELRAFYEAGITTFDCADIYTGVEELLGRFQSQYRIKNIQIHTKFVPDLSVLSRIDWPYVERIIDRSLKRLQTPTLDLVQFHWWDWNIPGYVETAHLLARLQQKGKIRHIGVTNFDSQHLSELLNAGIKVVSNQVQYSVLDPRPENFLKDLCQKQEIHLLAYGTVSGGFLSERWLGQAEPQPPFSNRSLIKYKLVIDDAGGWDWFQTLLCTLYVVGKRYEVGLTEIATAYVHGCTAAVITGANASHIPTTLRAEKLQLTEQDRAEIRRVVAQSKLIGDVYELERDKRGKHAAIMRYNLNESK